MLTMYCHNFFEAVRMYSFSLMNHPDGVQRTTEDDEGQQSTGDREGVCGVHFRPLVLCQVSGICVLAVITKRITANLLFSVRHIILFNFLATVRPLHRYWYVMYMKYHLIVLPVKLTFLNYIQFRSIGEPGINSGCILLRFSFLCIGGSFCPIIRQKGREINPCEKPFYLFSIENEYTYIWGWRAWFFACVILWTLFHTCMYVHKHHINKYIFDILYLCSVSRNYCNRMLNLLPCPIVRTVKIATSAWLPF